MRIGIFGGSFDPVHCGHLVLAESCRTQANLDRVWFVPASHQPFKPDGPFATNVDRLEMLKLALDGREDYEISTLEIDRGGMSYTIDTLLTVKSMMSEAQIFLLMGADSLRDFPYWRRPADICRAATPLVVNRAGEPAPNFEHLKGIVSTDRLAEIERQQVEMPPVDISSSEIRRLIAKHGNWQELVPEKVREYIRDHQLYLAR